MQFAILALVVALFLWWIHPRTPLEENPLVAVSTTTLQVAAFPATILEAGSAYVYDVHDHKTLFEKDADTIRPLASLTKLMSALTASKLIPNYLLVRITPDDIRQEGDTGLYVNEDWPLGKLVDYSLITSSNDGITAIAATGGHEISSTSSDPVALFVNTMNETAKSLGLSSMHYINQSGLDISPVISGGYGSARDITKLLDYILKTDPHLVEATSYDKTTISSTQITHTAENTNKALGEIPNVIASKTGYTDLSGGNVIVAFNAGLDHPIIIAVLGSSYDGRFTDLEALVHATITYLYKSGLNSSR